MVAGINFVPILATGALMIGCVSETPITQDHLNKISDSCGLEHQALVLETPTQAKFQPDIEADYQAVDCALKKIQRIRGLSFGFVGNEVYQVDKNGNSMKEGDEGY